MYKHPKSHIKRTSLFTLSYFFPSHFFPASNSLSSYPFFLPCAFLSSFPVPLHFCQFLSSVPSSPPLPSLPLPPFPSLGGVSTIKHGTNRVTDVSHSIAECPAPAYNKANTSISEVLVQVLSATTDRRRMVRRCIDRSVQSVRPSFRRQTQPQSISRSLRRRRRR